MTIYVRYLLHNVGTEEKVSYLRQNLKISGDLLFMMMTFMDHTTLAITQTIFVYDLIPHDFIQIQ
jgi:hypothetical protein